MLIVNVYLPDMLLFSFMNDFRCSSHDSGTHTTDVIRIDEEGYVHGPTKPGLGIDIDWEKVKAGKELKI